MVLLICICSFVAERYSHYAVDTVLKLTHHQDAGFSGTAKSCEFTCLYRGVAAVPSFERRTITHRWAQIISHFLTHVLILLFTLLCCDVLH